MTHHPTRSPLTRRDFLRTAALVGGAVALSPLLDACTGDEPGTPGGSIATESQPATPTPMPTLPPPDGRVAFVRTEDRAEGVRRAIELIAPPSLAGRSVFLKPNYNSDDPAPGSTHPDVLRALVGLLQEDGAGSITVGDRSGMGDTRAVMENLGVFEMADELGFDTVVFDELDYDSWPWFQPEGSHWQQGFHVAQPCLEADALIQACCLKTHQYGGHFTLSLKNSVGMVAKKVPGDPHNYMNELHDTDHQRRMIAEINATYAPALVVMDGVEAFVDRGPARGKRVSSQVVLAGTDRVALDAVGVAILRHFGTTPDVSRGAVFDQQQIARAARLGLGVDGPEHVEFITGDPESEAYAEQIRQQLIAG